LALSVGDVEVFGGSGDGDVAAVVGAVVVWADQGEVGQFGESAVLPVGVDGGRSVRACRPGYLPPPRPRTGRAALTASGSL
jgi:hypothetical protein